MALIEATKESKWIRTFLAELTEIIRTLNHLMICKSDNQSAITLTKNPHARAKYIDIRHHFIPKTIQDKIIWLQYPHIGDDRG